MPILVPATTPNERFYLANMDLDGDLVVVVQDGSQYFFTMQEARRQAIQAMSEHARVTLIIKTNEKGNEWFDAKTGVTLAPYSMTVHTFEDRDAPTEYPDGGSW